MSQKRQRATRWKTETGHRKVQTRKADHAHDTRHVRILAARRTDDTKAPSAECPEETAEPVVVELRVERPEESQTGLDECLPGWAQNELPRGLELVMIDFGHRIPRPGQLRRVRWALGGQNVPVNAGTIGIILLAVRECATVVGGWASDSVMDPDWQLAS